MTKQKLDIESVLEEFFNDPKHQKDSSFFRAAVKKILAEIEEEKKKDIPPEQESFFDRLFGKNE